MPFFFFAVPARTESPAHEELNRIFQRHKVLSVDRRFVEAGENSYWAVCVECLAAAAAGAAKPAGFTFAGTERAGARARPGFATGAKDNRVDYRDELTDEQFPIYSALRELRLKIATEESVKLFVVFTNRQLADMVVARASTKADLAKISGVGETRIEKYGARFLDELKRLGWSNATNGTPF